MKYVYIDKYIYSTTIQDSLADVLYMQISVNNRRLKKVSRIFI